VTRLRGPAEPSDDADTDLPGDTVHIAFVGAPLVSHTRPYVPLLSELVARGRRVTCALVGSLHPLVAPCGVDLLELPVVAVVPASGVKGPPTEVDALHHALEEAIVTLPVLLRTFADDPPDVVLYDSAALAGPLLAARLAVPAVQLNVHLVAWDGFEEEVGRHAEHVAIAEYRRYRERFARWLDLLDVRLDDHDAVLERPERLIERPARGLATIPRALQPHADRVDDRWTFVPMLDAARVAAGGWSAPAAAAGRPLLLVAFGTAHTRRPDIYRAVIEGFGDGSWHVVLAIGRHVERAALGSVPDCIEVHETVAQLAVLAHADCFVTHAGAGSATEALWNAVPMVAVPAAGDQFLSADQVTVIGAGWLLPDWAVNATALRRAVEGVRADRGMDQRLAAHRQALHAAGGAPRAADVVEAAR
jgi:MGT family glycosyltransferase